ncbi:MAG: bifunctional adenosylcobinamide kinase/adenosylcobinamide-phosphate guanylyltransferase [Proteobacteria bacterium]|nr:MAG: bifunctional adenosylcobinamide kinase/adenosylcobinamide-phosphate guanylyltransferase [Pseudomonadota bacterium]
MATIILVTGGARSGKSDYAQKKAESCEGPHCFIATGVVVDQEMEERIALHRKKREAHIWDTIEEPVDLLTVFKNETGYRTYLVDCLTLWVSNLMQHAHENKRDFDETAVSRNIEDILGQLEHCQATVIFVTNEVGMGIVPEHAVARRYRDLIGRCNRIIADAADEVILVSCGLPLFLK